MSASQYLRAASRLIEETALSDAPAAVERAAEAIAAALIADLPLLVCGNGGSAADAMHITTELVGRYLAERAPMRCICLAADPTMLTAWSNDYDFASVFARQVEAHARPGGVVLGISTSGNSPNVVAALAAARRHGMMSVALTGQGGGRCAAEADILIAVPSRLTPAIQEVHHCLYHYLCEQVEKRWLASQLDQERAG